MSGFGRGRYLVVCAGIIVARKTLREAELLVVLQERRHGESAHIVLREEKP